MAYCLRSLVQTLDEVLHPDENHKNWVLDNDKVPQIQSLFEIASFFRDFLDESTPLILDRLGSLEDQIMDIAGKAEDIIESHITKQLVSSSSEGQSCIISPPDLGQLIEAFEMEKQKVMASSQRSIGSSQRSSLVPSVGSKNEVVGVTEDLNQLKIRLTSQQATKLDIIPIVGMGGSGKTTLARILYDEYSSSKSHFDCYAWVTVSQTYDRDVVLSTLLSSCGSGKPLDETSNPLNEEEKETKDIITSLYQTLFGRRYLIVIDDIWNSKTWDDMQRAFPRDNKGSRIILTTRESIVAKYIGSKSHVTHLMNEDVSWQLLKRKVFGEKSSCPGELEDVGRRIAKNCGGLPLALKVIGGLLAHTQRSKDSWKHVSDNISSLIEEKDDKFSGIFSWSFANLPHYLKPCFLYMGAFPEDHVIPASKIIKLWVAEGFLYPTQDKRLEEAAETHLNSLVERNLTFVREWKKDGKVKSCGLHDLLRDLCLRKAQENKFIYLQDTSTKNLQDDVLCLRRVSVRSSRDMKLASHSRSFLLNGDATDSILSCLSFKFSLLRVLDLLRVEFDEFPEMILQLINLRYLAIYCWRGYLPTTISILGNLHILIANKITSMALINSIYATTTTP